MPDQAQGLRALMTRARGNTAVSAVPQETSELADAAVVYDTRPTTRCQPPSLTRVIAVTSGKGGVGKTNFSSNLALALVQAGKRVMVVDADLGLANLHVILGINPPYTLGHVMRGEKNLDETIFTGPLGLKVLAGASGMTELANLDSARRDCFLEQIVDLDRAAEIILLDTGAGVSDNVAAFLSAAREVIIVTTPEPTALTDAYATIKVISRQGGDVDLKLVVNMANNEVEARAVAERLTSISRRFLNIELKSLGFVPYDQTVPKSVRAQYPFLLSNANSAAAQAIVKIAGKLISAEDGSTSGAGLADMLQRMSRFFQRRTAAGDRL